MRNYEELPKSIKIGDKEYYLFYRIETEDEDFKGYVEYSYKDEYLFVPEVLVCYPDGFFWEYLMCFYQDGKTARDELLNRINHLYEENI